MISTVSTSKEALPQDPEKLRSYSWELSLAYLRLSEKYNKLLRKMYGRSTEKNIDTEGLDAIQMEMDELLKEALALEEESHSTEEEETIEITTHRRRRRKSGRNSIPEDLITEEILDIPEHEKKCDCCGREMTVFDKKHRI